MCNVLQCVHNVCMQEPVTITLGTEYRYKARSAKRCLIEKPETFQYVPLIENLEWVLQNTDVCHEVSVFSLSDTLNDINAFCRFFQ